MAARLSLSLFGISPFSVRRVLIFLWGVKIFTLILRFRYIVGQEEGGARRARAAAQGSHGRADARPPPLAHLLHYGPRRHGKDQVAGQHPEDQCPGIDSF